MKVLPRSFTTYYYCSHLMRKTVLSMLYFKLYVCFFRVGIGLTKIIDNAGTKKNCEQDNPL